MQSILKRLKTVIAGDGGQIVKEHNDYPRNQIDKFLNSFHEIVRNNHQRHLLTFLFVHPLYCFCMVQANNVPSHVPRETWSGILS